jgi:ABC-type lipoprotein release transport system permease subunit
MRLYWRLAWRNIWRHKRRTIIIVLAMAMSLGMMMMYDGLITGFNQAIYGNAVKVLGGNIQVHAPGYRDEADSMPLLPLADPAAIVAAAAADSRVESATQRINTGGLAISREGAFAVGITGIEPEKEESVNIAEQNIVAGRNLTSSDGDMALIGKGLADAMGVQAGDRFTLTGRAQHEQMRQRTMTVAGIYDLGMPDLEKRTVYVSLPEAQNLYNLAGQATEVAIVLKQLGQEDAVIGDLSTKVAGYEIEPFYANYPELAAAISAKGGVMNVFGVIITMIAGLGILNLLLMAIFERTREIGVMGAMGLKPRQISLLFVLEGAMIGVVGVIAGIAVGLLFNGLLRQAGMDFSAFSSATEYMALITGKVYPGWGVDKLLTRSLTILIICTLAAVIPAIEAGRREPAEALHFV